MTSTMICDTSQSIVHNILYASQLISRAMDRRFRVSGLTYNHVSVLLILWEKGPLKQKDLVGHMAITQTAITAIISRMTAIDLVLQSPNPGDGRSVIISLTDKSRRKMNTIWSELKIAESDTLKGFTDPERDNLLNLVKMIVSNIWEPQPTRRKINRG